MSIQQIFNILLQTHISKASGPYQYATTDSDKIHPQMTYPDIKTTRPDALWYPSGVDYSTDDVKESHEYDPPECSVVEGMR